MNKTIIFIAIHKMFPTGLQGNNDRCIIRNIRDQLVEGYCNRGLLFILSRFVFTIIKEV